MKYNFYGLDLDKPLGADVLADRGVENSRLGKLRESSGKDDDGEYNVDVVEVAHGYRSSADFCWRVVDAFYSPEDSTMTYFRAYGMNDEHLSGASFGVWFSSCKFRTNGHFRYKPLRGSQYYMPVINNFFTPNSGGYEVQVLDTKYPSETLKFGMNVSGKQHQSLIVSFKLFELKDNYPAF